jgi:hypothetical protein
LLVRWKQVGSSEPQLQQPDKSKDDDTDNIAKARWQDVRGEEGNSGRQWGMCTIRCMYREQVDGPGGYDDTAMAVEQPSRAAKVFSSNRVRPRAARDPEAPAGMPKGQGRRRKEGGIGTAMRSSTSMLAG